MYEQNQSIRYSPIIRGQKKEESNQVIGEQYIVELYNCNSQFLDDMKHVEQVMLDAADAAHATVVAHKFHKFAPQGISGAVIVAESHLAIHTWPEFGYCAIDIFTCGEHTDNAAALEAIKKGLGAKNCNVVKVKMRGLNQSMLIESEE